MPWGAAGPVAPWGWEVGPAGANSARCMVKFRTIHGLIRICRLFRSPPQVRATVGAVDEETEDSHTESLS